VLRHGAGQLDRADDVRGELAVDLLVRELFGDADEAVAGLRRDDVDAAELGERGVCGLSSCRGGASGTATWWW
jgi:hypothetical protein